LRLLEKCCGLSWPDSVFLSFNEHNGSKRLRQIEEDLRKKNVVFASDAGMPAISDPGSLLVRYCIEKNIEYDVLPGPSAVTTVYAASGFENGRFLFYGFLPREGSARKSALEEIMRNGVDSVVYEAPHRLMKLIGEIVQIDPERKLFLAKELSKQYQKYYCMSAGEAEEYLLKEKKIRGEWAIVIEGKDTAVPSLHAEEILRMDLPPKSKAKLLAHINGESVKTWYDRLSGKQKRKAHRHSRHE